MGVALAQRFCGMAYGCFVVALGAAVVVATRSNMVGNCTWRKFICAAVSQSCAYRCLAFALSDDGHAFAVVIATICPEFALAFGVLGSYRLGYFGKRPAYFDSYWRSLGILFDISPAAASAFAPD